MKTRNAVFTVPLIAVLFCTLPLWAAEKPNVVLILVDDMGYGDPGCFNVDSKIPTPHIDRLAKEGMRFTNAHSPSGICVPTRYGLLTGRFPVRTWTAKDRRIKDDGGWECPHYGLPTISRDRRESKETLNLAQLLQQNGYATACLGKWHQGALRQHTLRDDGTFAVSPIHFGFDYYFGFEAAGSAGAWIENDRYVQAPTEKMDVKITPYVQDDPVGVQRVSRAAAPGWDVYKVLPTLAEKAEAWLKEQVAEDNTKPFFLYYPLPAPHTPVTPGPDEVGKSRAGMYGDFVVSVDTNVGKVLAALKRLGLEKNSLVFFTSDNGPAYWRGLKTDPFQHRTAGPWNGGKGSILEGGHRMPFIARWPGQIAPGTTCDQRICFTDFLATMADMLDVSLPNDAGGDSFSFLPLLHDTVPPKPIRSSQIHDQYGSYRVGYTLGDWKLILPQRTYFVHDRKVVPDHVVPDKPFELYDLRSDPSETTNLAEKNPERLQSVFAALKADIERGRSRPIN
jgi:arylsulfatase A-like enzyme